MDSSYRAAYGEVARLTAVPLVWALLTPLRERVTVMVCGLVVDTVASAMRRRAHQ
jgi:hypothetical protein